MPPTTPLPVRAFMLDVSRDRVPTRETLGLYVDLLAASGYDQFELYTEHTFAHAGQEQVWRDASPLTADDMRWLDGLCASRGIALVANRNGLGHMERFLQHDLHRWRAELPGGFDQWGGHQPPSTLAVTGENLAFVNGLYEELVATTTAKAVNIGMDEPWEFGRGATRERVEREGAGAVYTDWVLAVATPWLEKGYRVEMWGDILGHHPEQAARLPAGLALVLWGYESPDRLRCFGERDGAEVGPRPGFGDQSAPFAGRGSDLWVAPGTGVWNSVCGRLGAAVDNILDAVAVGSELGAGGFIATSWGDNGHWEGPVQTLVPVLVGGLASSDPDNAGRLADRAVLVAEVGRILFGDQGHPGAELLVGLGMLDDLVGVPAFNATRFFQGLFGHQPGVGVPPERYHAVLAEVSRLRELADRIAPAGWVDEVRTVLRLVEVAVARLLGDQREVDAGLVAELRRNWLATSRVGGLDDSLARAKNVAVVAPAAGEASAEGDAQAARDYWHGILDR